MTLDPRRRQMFTSLRCAAGAAILLATTVQAQGLGALEREIGRLSGIAGGKLGVGIIHLETGRELHVNADQPFPMASTFKVPVAVQLLRLVDQGRVRLDSMITIRPQDLHPGSGTLSGLFDDPGVSLSLRNLLELMLLISDNSATDLVLTAAGGGPAVNARLAELAVKGISVDRPTILLIADAIGIRSLPPEFEWSRAGFQKLSAAVTEAERDAARKGFLADRRDTATPRGMAQLLAKIWKGETLSKTSTELLIDIMFRCETGALRIKGMLPPGTRVAHKTGSLDLGIANDVGIVELPDGAGHVALAVFQKEATKGVEDQERTIAQIARAVYDYFLLVR
ncbi:MAG: class A beta-lactamase [Acidobacteriota bacterium]|nr:class A beta-lactamase [Acidobacteriota bacterium]